MASNRRYLDALTVVDNPAPGLTGVAETHRAQNHRRPKLGGIQPGEGRTFSCSEWCWTAITWPAVFETKKFAPLFGGRMCQPQLD